MDKRTVTAIILSLAVIIAYQYLFMPAPPKVTEQPSQADRTDKKEKVTVQKQPETAQPVAAAPEVQVVQRPAREIRVENELYVAELSSLGGSISHWEIKPYKDENGENVQLLKEPGILPAVSMGSSPDFDLSGLDFRVTGRELNLNGDNRSGSIVFEHTGDGYSIRRTYTFYSDTYKVDLVDEVSGLRDYWITLGSDFGIFDDEDSYTHVGPILLSGTDLEEFNAKDLRQSKQYKDNLKWIAQEDKYFFAALVPETPVEEARAWTFKGSPVVAFRGTAGVNKFALVAGPKKHDRLKKLGLSLEHIVNFGFFSVVSIPLFYILLFFYKYTGNYGWAIVLLTLVTRIPFIPIVSKGQKSMKRLQSLQPKMNEIKEKYKKDSQKMQKEMTELYKKHKVNPISGCLPMLIQIPVFIALYKVLLVAIELRGAPFMLWITDLSAKDPYYVLPIVMGATMLLQQKMTPSGMDPKQAKLMLLMPVVFTFLFLQFASGLVLYWLVNNIFGIAQQLLANRKAAKEAAKELA
jgi:YidC/Oxa1 family membrane protein insertase